MALPASVAEFIASQNWGAVVSARPVSGGCINNATRLETERGLAALLKHNSHAPQDMFAREAEGLAALAVPGGPRVPAVYGCGADWLLVEYLEPAPRGRDFWRRLGEQLACLHATTADRFGFPHDNYIGSTPQPNRWTDDGHAFFAERRLRFQGRLARERGRLSGDDLRLLERLIARLPQLVPAQPASLIHGDLWGGNLIVGPQGEPALIDPAAHYGWAEAELAMTTLFGSFDPAAYRAYEAARPLDPGYRDRFDIYNLYHLLNHLNLFGHGYYGQVAAILRRYG